MHCDLRGKESGDIKERTEYGRNSWDLCYLEQGISILAPGNWGGGIEGRSHLRRRREVKVTGQEMVTRVLIRG